MRLWYVSAKDSDGVDYESGPFGWREAMRERSHFQKMGCVAVVIEDEHQYCQHIWNKKEVQ